MSNNRLGYYDRNSDGRIDFSESVYAHAHMQHMENMINASEPSIYDDGTRTFVGTSRSQAKPQNEDTEVSEEETGGCLAGLIGLLLMFVVSVGLFFVLASNGFVGWAAVALIACPLMGLSLAKDGF